MAGVAPPVLLAATHQKSLKVSTLAELSSVDQVASNHTADGILPPLSRSKRELWPAIIKKQPGTSAADAGLKKERERERFKSKKRHPFLVVLMESLCLLLYV